MLSSNIKIIRSTAAVVLMDPFFSHLSIYKICCVSKHDYRCAAVKSLFPVPT